MRHLSVAVTIILAAGIPARAGWLGYRGPDGTGVFADSRPPVECDMKTGKNILWRTSLPNWSHAAPTIVKGRAFVMSEPGWKSDWPLLTCIDTQSGKTLWEKSINHLPLTKLDAAGQQDAARKWHNFQAEWRKLYTTFAETVGQGKPDDATARLKAMGYEFGGYSGGGYGQLRRLKPKPSIGTPRDAGLREDVWRHNCGLGYDEIGAAFATPATDGQHVYVLASRSVAACYDFDGNLRWMTFVGLPPDLRGYNESNGRSAVIYKDLLISDYFGHLYALDKGTGQVRWTVKSYAGGIATPVIATVGGTDVLITEGYQGVGGGIYAVRLPDGKLLKLSGCGPGGNANLLNTDHRDIVYFSSGVHSPSKGPDNNLPQVWEKTPVAVKFTLEGETLKPTVLWTGTDHAIAMVYHNGKLYIGSTVYDALTGEVLAGGRGKPGSPPPTRHYLLLAGDKLYGLNGFCGLANGPPPADKPVATLYCQSLDGRKLGASPLYMAPVTSEKLEQTRSQVGWDRWGFGYGMPFMIDGNRIYLRSSDELICVGEK
jgi:outer membrane protein assembly factor BamB